MRLLGSIDPLPSGRYRYRVTVRRKQAVHLVDTMAEALALQLAVSQRAHKPPSTTLGDYGAVFLDWRETVQKRRSVRTDRSRWRVHVEPAALARMPLAELTQRDIEAWADKLQGSTRTRRNTLNLLRQCLARAKRERLIASNQALGVRIDGDEPDAWTYLDEREQRLLMTSPLVPEPDRVLIAFAIGSGLRQGEQWALRLTDLRLDDDDPHVVVRFGSRGKTTKTGRVRRVPLVPWLVEVMRGWVDALPGYLVSPAGKQTYRNEHGLVFPTWRGSYRRGKKPPRKWGEWLTALRIEGVTGRPVTWHSLRHTCASMLVSGAWGRRWTLQEVAELLGHASIETTERYAHLAEGTIARAARETMSRPCHAGAESRRATLDSNQWPSVPETCDLHVASQQLEPEMTSSMTSLAADVVRMVAAGDGRAIARALQLAEAVLEMSEARRVAS